MRIAASSTISHQPTFRKGFSTELSVLIEPSELITPDYSAFIPAMDRRRMSDVLKMAITCAADCLEQAGLKQPEAIIVGTSMGCPNHTRNFLDKILNSNGGLISPTSFILSTHNTIAGQISLQLKNHGYNVTHTQNSLSFEQALIDGILCLENGHTNVLVGAADELESALFNMNARLGLEHIHVTSGASFFILSSETREAQAIHLIDVGSYGLITDLSGIVTEFLKQNNLSAGDIDILLYSNSNQNTREELKIIFGDKKLFDYQQISGVYFTNSGFAMNYGFDILSQGRHPSFDQKISKILICNNLVPENLGLILLGNSNR